jgi:signal recognition particle receptor subunit beta
LSFINFAAREINCKIVYYGAGLGGKTTNLQHIFQKTAEQQKGKMISLATETERTLFFDFLPLDLGSVRGFKTRIHLYTVPGQVFYDASRKLILRGVDGIVFVADSQQERMDANTEALDNLMSNLNVLQLNKRDLPNILPVETLAKELQRKGEPVIEAVAFQGQGVFETLKEIARQVLVELKKGS